MKPHLPLSLFKAVAFGAIAFVSFSTTEAETFMAEGVSKNGPWESPRFYDSGKGYYWSWNYLSNAVRDEYNRTGSFAFLGDLASRIKDPAKGVTDQTFHYLEKDGDTCWEQTSINLIEYWLDTFGIFYTGSAELPYGYTYDKKYLYDFGGTQSLKVGMYMYDSFADVGGFLSMATDWFFNGDSSLFSMRKGTKLKGGFFKSYFSGDTYVKHAYGSALLGKSSPNTTKLAKDIRRGLGFSISTTEREKPGQIVYLGLTGTESITDGHAITCYGLETDADGNAYCLYVCNSDDEEYKLFPVYVKKSKGELRLYEDPERTKLWEYADTNWYIEDVQYINTPKKLLNKAQQYNDKSNPMVWTGKQSTWSNNSDASKFTLRLPTWSDAWMISVDGDYYPIFFEKNRTVEFNNFAIPKSGSFSRKVTVSGTVNVKQLRLTVDSRDENGNYTAKTYNYVFNGTQNAHIKTNNLYLSNYGFYHFDGVNLTVNTLTGTNLDNPWLDFKNGSVFTVYKSYEIPSAGFYLDNSTMSMPQLTLSNNGNLRTYGKSKFKGNICLKDGGILSFEYPTTAGKPDPFLTITGDLNIQGDSTAQFLGLTKEGIYPIASFNTFSGDITKLKANCPDLGGSKQFVWVIPAKTLTFVLADSVYRFAGSGKVWQDGSGFKNNGNTLVVLGFNAATTVDVKGKVTPKAILAAQDKGILLRDGGSGNISGTAKLDKTGAGTLNIDLANTYTGGTYIHSGTVLTSNVAALGKGKAALCGGTLNMGSLPLTNTVSVEGNGYVRQSGAFAGALILTKGNLMGDDLNLASAKAATLRSGSVKNNLVGMGRVIKDTTGTVNLYGSNGYRGGTIVKAGTLVARTATALGAGKVTLTGGTLNLMSNAAINTIDINTSTSATLRGISAMQGNFVLTKGTVMGADIRISDKKTATLKSGTVKNRLAGAGKVVKSTAGTAILANSSLHTGGTVIKDGTLITKNPYALGAGKVTLSGGTLDMCCKQLGNDVNINASQASILRGNKYNGDLTLTSGALSGDAININSYRNFILNKGSVSNDICGDGTVYKKTTSTVTLTGGGTWTGNTYVQAGTLVLAGHATLFGTMCTYSGATLSVKNTSYFMNLYLGGGTLTSTATAKIVVPGTVTLGSATRLNVTGMGDDAVNFLSYGNINNPGNWDLTAFFKLSGSGYVVLASNGNLILAKESDYKAIAKARTLAAPDLTMPEVAQQEDDTVEIAEAPAEEEETQEEPVVAARDITAEELSKLLGASGPVYSAELGSLAQSAWGTARAARLFDHTVRDHGGSAANLSLDEHGTRSAWFATMGGFSRVRAEGAAMGADNNTYGGVVGMQFNGALGGNAGLAIGQSYGKVSPMGAARVDQQTQHAAIYGTKTLYAGAADCMRLTGTVSYGTTDSDCNSNGHGFEWTQHSVVLGARGTWAHAVGRDTSLYTFAGLEYLATDSGDTENGKSGSVQDFQGAIGAGVSHTMGKLTLHADAAFEYDLVRHNPVAESAGRRGAVSNPGRIGMEVRAGANYRINDRWNAEAGYSCHAAQHNTSHEAHIGASYSF